MKHTLVAVAAVVLVAAGIVGHSLAQPVPPAAAGEPRWTPAQLDQLTAPIALYPDPLLGSILAASTYPLEVVEAARWMEDPAHAALKGEALETALGGQPWDPAVKSLVPFPAVLRLLNSNIEWTEQLGDAFLAQQADVMDSVQRLRQRALAQGGLQSTPQQTVATDQNAITIEPASPDVVYVPYYVPAIYGPWPWPDYPPYDFGLPPGVFIGDALIGFGIGIGFFEPPWGWYGCNWPGHGVVVYPPYPHHPGNPPRPYPYPRLPPKPWQHDPQHRDGVPYRDGATAARYLGAETSGQRAFRGYPAEPSPGHPAQPAPQAAPRETRPAPTPPIRETSPAPRPQGPTPRPSYQRPTAPPSRAAPPAFESFGRGPQVRSEAARGSSSRSAPSGGGGGHAGGHR